MRRFYKVVSAATQDSGVAILLDGKPVRMPSGRPLLAPGQEIADLVVQEWAAQANTIDPQTMPLTQIITTARERVADERAAITQAVLAYLDTDLLCYRAGTPEALAQRQEQLWDPWLDWFRESCGVSLKTTTALQALEQPEAAHRVVAARVDALDLWRFTVLQMVTAISGSVVLALAFVDGRAAPEDILRAMHAEEDYRAEIYNESVHGAAPHQEQALLSKTRDLQALWQILQHARDGATASF